MKNYRLPIIVIAGLLLVVGLLAIGGRESTPAAGWGLSSACVDKQWVLTNPENEPTVGDILIPAGGSATVPQGTNSVTVHWPSDTGDRTYVRPRGCKVYETTTTVECPTTTPATTVPQTTAPETTSPETTAPTTTTVAETTTAPTTTVAETSTTASTTTTVQESTTVATTVPATNAPTTAATTPPTQATTPTPTEATVASTTPDAEAVEALPVTC